MTGFSLRLLEMRFGNYFVKRDDQPFRVGKRIFTCLTQPCLFEASIGGLSNPLNSAGFLAKLLKGMALEKTFMLIHPNIPRLLSRERMDRRGLNGLRHPADLQDYLWLSLTPSSRLRSSRSSSRTTTSASSTIAVSMRGPISKPGGLPREEWESC